jgi:hypothetical protein
MYEIGLTAYLIGLTTNTTDLTLTATSGWTPLYVP